MKKYIYLAFVIGLFFLSGCSKKDQQTAGVTTEEMTTTVVSAAQPKTGPLPGGVINKEPRAASVNEPVSMTAENPAAEAPAVPSEKDIQLALKNAGFYEGDIDGKLGPKTKMAIEAFQTKNNLQVDGKVGKNTWGKLKEFFSSPSQTVPAEVKD